jgi:thiol-disulfide isomerase/thioredoxin
MTSVLRLAVIVAIVTMASVPAAAAAVASAPEVVAPEDYALELSKKVVAIVTFHKPGCGACEAYLPAFKAAAADYYAGSAKDASASLTSFVTVEISEEAGAAAQRLVRELDIRRFPTVRVVVRGDFVMPVKLEEQAKTSQQLVQVATTVAKEYGTGPTAVDRWIRNVVDVELVVAAEMVDRDRVVVLGTFGEDDLHPWERVGADADRSKLVSECRRSFDAAAVGLADIPWLVFYTTFNTEVQEAFLKRRDVDQTLDGWRVHPDELSDCASKSSVTILKCGSRTGASDCTRLGALFPTPSSRDQMLRALAAHALPLLPTYESSAEPLLDRAWLDRSTPLPPPAARLDGLKEGEREDPRLVKASSHYNMRINRRTRPVLIYFTQVRNCGEESSEGKKLKYVRRTLAKLAESYTNMTFVVADSIEYNHLYLRLGFKRKHADNEIVFGIFDGGRRYSAVDLNLTAGYATDKIADFVDAFNQGRIPRYWTSSRARGFKDILGGAAGSAGKLPCDAASVGAPDARGLLGGLRVISSKDLERSLFRLDCPPTEADRRMLGGMEDLVLVLFAHAHCRECKELVKRFHRMGEVQQRLLVQLNERNLGTTTGDVPSMFLEVPQVDYLESAIFGESLRKLKAVSVVARDSAERRAFEGGDSDFNNAAEATEAVEVELGPKDSDEEAFKLFEERVLAGLRPPHGRPSADANGLRRVRLFAVNTTLNVAPTEHWQNSPRTSSMPIIAAAFRSSRVAYTDGGAPFWDVTVHSPSLLNYLTDEFDERLPREPDLLDFAMQQLRHGIRHGQRFVR